MHLTVIISSVRAIFSGIILLPVGALQVTLVSYSTTAVSQLCMKLKKFKKTYIGILYGTTKLFLFYFVSLFVVRVFMNFSRTSGFCMPLK